MTPRNFGHQGKRDDQVTFAELVAGMCVGLMLVLVIGSCCMRLAR